MAHAHAEYPTLACPHCGTAFTAEVWLIIDAAERPDLLARVVAGSIHTVACPNGHDVALDAPLLIYRPEEAPPLVFSLAAQTTVEQDRQMAAGLVGLLRGTLGRAWREEWLAESAAVPRERLPALLSGDAAALGGGRTRGESVGEWDALFDELTMLTRPEHMPRRVALLRRALGQLPATDPELWAVLQGELGNALAQNPLGKLADNLEQAIAAYEAALTIYTRDAFPERWATLQNNLGAIYDKRIRGERADNQERAIAAYAAALTVYTRNAFSQQWAAAQHNLGNVLKDRLQGERADNQERAIAAYAAALTVYTRDAFPADWAMTHNGLGNAYSNRLRGERADNQERAIAAYAAALTVYTRDAFPADWAMTHNNLGTVYYDHVAGERADNLEQAIAAYEAALMVYARDTSPAEWAGTQHNLGKAYRDRIRGERADNLERAIAAYTAALQVTTHDTFPEEWAATQLNLGIAYSDRIRSERADNLERAIAAYTAALEVYTRDDFAEQWATIHNNLGVVYRDRIRGEQADNLERAIAAYEAALTVYTRDAFPTGWAMTHNNLGIAYRARIRGERAGNLEQAIAAYEAALQVRTRDAFPEQWAMTQNNLGAVYSDRVGGERADNLERAIAAYEASLTVYTRDAFPELWLAAQFNLGIAYGDRIQGKRADNLAAAIAAYTAALDGINEAFLELSVASITTIQSNWMGLYARLTAALLEAGRPADALAAAEGVKSRLLTLLVSRGDLPAPPGLPAALVAAEQRAATALHAIDAGALADLKRAEVEPEATIRDRVTDRAAVVADLRAAWAEMEAYGPAAAGYVALRRGDRPTADGLRRLAGALPPGVALLSLFDTGRRTLLYLLPAGATEPLVIETALDRDDLIHDYLPSYEDEVLNRAAWRRLGRPLSHRWRALGRPLLGALRPHLAGIDHLVIAPEGVYHQLPLHALWIGAADCGDAGDTLIDHCAVSYVPALGVLERRPGADRRPPTAGRAPIASGSAVVMGYTNADPTTEEGAVERAVFLGEARAVAARLGVEPLLDGAATPAALAAATAEPRRVLHLSCHGYFDPGDALRSGVLLAGGVYTARRFLERRLPAKLVTLSACQTALSGSVGGDEMAGLSLALLSAGAGALLLGLWNVNAATTARLMDDFYARLDGAGQAAALRGAMLALRDGLLSPPPDIDPADPYYWAPFVLVGEWR